jgi:SOS-response transcriptional repressor LexA
MSKPFGTNSQAVIEKTNEVFNYIISYKRRNDGNSPTLRQIMAACKIASVSMVHWYLRVLQRRGLIEIIEGSVARGIKVAGGNWGWQMNTNQKQEDCNERNA